MTVQSAYNVVVPLDRPGEAGTEWYVLFNTLAGSLDVIDRGVADGLAEIPSGALKGFVPVGHELECVDGICIKNIQQKHVFKFLGELISRNGFSCLAT